jgi:hypothetical protein
MTEEARPIRSIQSGLPIPANLPLDEQIRLLLRRVDRIEYEAKQDRELHKTVVQQLRSHIGAEINKLHRANQDLRNTTKSIAISTVRLQMIGLILVGLGTLLMAIPAIYALVNAL